MRKKEKIEEVLENHPHKTIDRIKIELLLDIRQLLVDVRTALSSLDVKGEAYPAIDCNVIPDRATLVKAKEKLDKLLKKP